MHIARPSRLAPAAVALVSLLAGTLPPRGAAAAASAWSALKGRIFVSDAEFGTDYGSDAGMIKAVKKQSKPIIKGGDAWPLNMMVFLKEAPGADKINIVYYDITAKPREQVNFSEVAVKPDQKIVQVNGVAISKDLGFVKGHKYDVLATRLINKKEKVYAKATVTLK